jgi:hypothetical protein
MSDQGLAKKVEQGTVDSNGNQQGSPKKSRRKFIFAGATGLIVVPLATVARIQWGSYPVFDNLKFLTHKEAYIVGVVADVLYPPEALGLNPGDVSTVKNMDDLYGNLSKIEQKEVSLLLWATEHILPLFSFKFKKFSQLSLDDRSDILTRINKMGAPLPLLVKGLKFFIGMSYFSSSKTHEKLGYAGWCGP